MKGVAVQRCPSMQHSRRALFFANQGQPFGRQSSLHSFRMHCFEPAKVSGQVFSGGVAHAIHAPLQRHAKGRCYKPSLGRHAFALTILLSVIARGLLIDALNRVWDRHLDLERGGIDADIAINALLLQWLIPSLTLSTLPSLWMAQKMAVVVKRGQ